MKTFNNHFLHTQQRNLRNRQNKDINYHHLRWKPLKSNFQKFFLILGKKLLLFSNTV